jgi:hypothetical protein
MEIRHRIAISPITDPHLESILGEFGVKYKIWPLPDTLKGLITFDIEETEPAWKVVCEWARTGRVSNVYDTVFTPDEIRQAEWIRLIPMHEQGYAQPKNLGWIRLVYDDVCPQCGAGYRQKAPYRLEKEPHLGRYDFMSLFATYGVFCTPKVVTALKAHEFRGYEVWDALIHRTKQPSTVVSQLVFPLIAAPGLADVDKVLSDEGVKELIASAGGEWHATCPHCSITKYTPHMRGYMHVHREAFPPDTDVVQSYEWFGSGHAAYREIFISKRFARLILDEGWRGLRLKPVELI